MFYHISKKDLGVNVKFTPRVPDSALVSIEGNIPRVCVSSSLLGCIRGICGTNKVTVSDIIYGCKKDVVSNSYCPLTVYLAPADIYPYVPPNVSDYRANKEHWYLSVIKMRRIGYIDFTALLDGCIEIIDYKKTLSISEDILANYKLITNRRIKNA